MKVAAIGDNVVDIYLDQQQMYLGGNSLNFANFATEFPNVKSIYIGNFGNDDLSEYIKDTLTELDVDYAGATELVGESGYSIVSLHDGDRVFVTSNRGGVLQQGIRLTEDNLTQLREMDLVHFNLNGNADEWIAQMGSAKVVYDYSDYSKPEDIKQTIQYVDIACFSMGGKSVEEIQALVALVKKLHVKQNLVILVTRGAQGAMAYFNRATFYQSATKADRVVDTMGAGDAFITAFSINLIETGFNEDGVRQALKIASEYSAKQVQKNGSFGHAASVPERFLEKE